MAQIQWLMNMMNIFQTACTGLLQPELCKQASQRRILVSKTNAKLGRVRVKLEKEKGISKCPM